MEKRRKRSDEAASMPEGCNDLRCGCGRLIARLVPGGVELKCGRCHQITVVPLVPDDAETRPPGRRGAPA